MKISTKKVLAILLSIVLVFSSVVFTPINSQKNVYAATTVKNFYYNFANGDAGYAYGTVVIEANVDGEYIMFWGDSAGNKLKKNGYEYTQFLEITVTNGNGYSNVGSKYTVIPEGAKTVLVYKDNVKQHTYTIPANKVFSPKGQAYTFGAISDIHYDRYKVDGVDPAIEATDNALSFLNSIGVKFVGVTGDITSDGEQKSLDSYNNAIAKYPNMTVVSCVGNHDSRNILVTGNVTLLDSSLGRWYNSITSTYFSVGANGTFSSKLNSKYKISAIGTPICTEYRTVSGGAALTKNLPALDFVIEDGNIVYIIFNPISKTGTAHNTADLFTTQQMDWLAAQLAKYKDKKMFLFTHSYLPVNTSDGDVVNINNCTGDLRTDGGYSYNIDFKDDKTTSDGKNMRALFQQYKNLTMFSGHSHWEYALQKLNREINIGKLSGGQGATLIHLSSVTEPRTIEMGDSSRTSLAGKASEGTTVTVYDNYIVYNAIDFKNKKYEAYATYFVQLGDDNAVTTPTKPTKVKKPGKVKITKIKKLSKKTARLTWKKIKGVKGYQIKYSTSSKMKKAKYKVVKRNTNKYVIKGLKRKKYYIQIRAYKVVNKRKYYGKWSNKKIVNMKRRK